jgi:hypothetical protein
MRNHRKIKALRAKFGLKSYAVWSMMLEYLTGCDNNIMKNNELELELLSGDFNLPINELKEILAFCFKLDLLKCEGGIIYSPSLKERLAPVYQNRQNNSAKVLKRYDKSLKENVPNGTITGVSLKDMTRNSTAVDVSLQESLQSKVNKRELYTENTLSTKSSIVRPIGENFEKNGKVNHNSGSGVPVGKTEGEIDPPLPF